MRSILTLTLLSVIVYGVSAASWLDDFPKKIRSSIFTDECFDNFFIKKLFNSECISLTISKLLGLGIVTASVILKVPQIINIQKAQSCVGLSFNSMWIECIQFIFMISYSIFESKPFLLYGELVFIVIQNLIIMMLFVVYKNVSFGRFISTFILLAAIGFPMIYQYLPSQIYQASMIINIVLTVLIKSPVIINNLKNKSTGVLSLITVTLQTLGNLARLFTVIKESPDDLLYILTNFITFGLNGTILAQIFIYWSASSAQKKDKKE